MPFQEVIDGLVPYVLEGVPEGALNDDEALTRIDYLIGHFANLYAYLISLYVYASEEVIRLKVAARSQEATVVIRKRDAFYELARAAKLKHAACSRLVTISSEQDDLFESPDYKRRSGRKKGGWDHVKGSGSD